MCHITGESTAWETIYSEFFCSFNLLQQDVDYKKFACKKFKQGKCNLGDDCKYSHAAAALSSSSSSSATNDGDHNSVCPMESSDVIGGTGCTDYQLSLEPDEENTSCNAGS